MHKQASTIGTVANGNLVSISASQAETAVGTLLFHFPSAGETRVTGKYGGPPPVRSADRAPGFYVLRRGKALPPFPAPLCPLAASFLRCAPDRFLLTKPNTFPQNQDASVATLRWCSGSSRNAVRLPFGMSVQLHWNPHVDQIGNVLVAYPLGYVPRMMPLLRGSLANAFTFTMVPSRLKESLSVGRVACGISYLKRAYAQKSASCTKRQPSEGLKIMSSKIASVGMFLVGLPPAQIPKRLGIGLYRPSFLARARNLAFFPSSLITIA
jgi:hypothetical protein